MAFGECAPLPQLSCDDVPNYVEILAEACQLWEKSGQLPREFFTNLSLYFDGI